MASLLRSNEGVGLGVAVAGGSFAQAIELSESTRKPAQNEFRAMPEGYSPESHRDKGSVRPSPERADHGGRYAGATFELSLNMFVGSNFFLSCTRRG